MKKNKIFITVLSIILVLLFITSCSRETLVSPEETKVVEEKTKEEVEPERPSIDYSKETHDIKYDGYIPTFLCAGEVNLIKITLKNKSSFTWPSSGKFPVRVGYRLRHGEITDSLWEGLTDPIRNIIMGVTAENLAEKYNITREEQDEYAARSQMRATRAIVEGRFKEEIVPVMVPQKRGEPIKFETDEFPKPGISKEKLALYPTVFKKGGTVTPGNSCGINDGAAALIVMGDDIAKKRGLKPIAKILSYGVAAVDPAFMGIGPVYAIPKALERAGLKLEDMDLIELNEAFAAQVLAVTPIMMFLIGSVNPSQRESVISPC
ncbi:unnamed protein product, partial [marine sediment metagenome]